MKSTFRKILWGFLALVLVQSACLCNLTNLLGTPAPTHALTATAIPATPLPGLPTQPAPTLPVPADVYPPPFASYSLASVSLPQTFNGGGYSLPLDLGQVQGLDLVNLTAAQTRPAGAKRLCGGRAGAGQVPRVLPGLRMRPL